MINFLAQLFCWHDYQKISEVKVYEPDYSPGDLPIYFIIVYKCKTCGKFKKIKI